MKWFKHISDSLDDPFIFDLMEEFGHSGYVAFFGTLEIYAREFEPDFDWRLEVSCKLLRQKLHFSQEKRLKKVLDYIGKIGKWEVKYEGKKVIIHVPKFYKFLDESTLRKLRQKREKFRNDSGYESGKDPEQLLPIDADADVDKDNTNVLSEDRPKKPPAESPGSKPAAQAPSASKHFSCRVGECLDAIKRHCEDIDKRCRVNGKRFNPWEWVTRQTNIRGHPLAITQSLEWLLVNWDEVDNPWGFVDATFKTKNPKFNERQEAEDSKAFKAGHAVASKEFKALWKKLMGGKKASRRPP